jgi:hypothetical protein
MGSLPQPRSRGTTARRVKDHVNNNPLRSGRGLGAPSPQMVRTTQHDAPGASVPVLHAQCLRPQSASTEASEHALLPLQAARPR